MSGQGERSAPGAGALLAALVLAAAAFWFVWSQRAVNFWLGMALADGVLGVAALSVLRPRGATATGRPLRQGDFALGFAAAAVLYGLAWLGRLALGAAWPAGLGGVAAIYAWTAVAPWQLIALIVALVIAPGEEIFWRGWVLTWLRRPLPSWAAVVVAALAYAAVRLFSGNVVLAVAALAGGLYWGAMYLRFGRVGPVIVSHALFGLAALLFFPLR